LQLCADSSMLVVSI